MGFRCVHICWEVGYGGPKFIRIVSGNIRILGALSILLASVSFRQLPWTSVASIYFGASGPVAPSAKAVFAVNILILGGFTLFPSSVIILEIPWGSAAYPHASPKQLRYADSVSWRSLFPIKKLVKSTPQSLRVAISPYLVF